MQTPAGMAKATEPSAQAAISNQMLNDALISATNNPEWTKAYIALLQKQHAEMLAALRGGRAPAPAPTPAKGGIKVTGGPGAKSGG